MMPWVRLDDQFHAHPKAQDAWHECKASLGLHLLALSNAGSYLTDGYVSETFVKTHLPKTPERRRVIAALLHSGLWEEHIVKQGYQIHDYLKYNESRAQVLTRRQADSSRKRSGIQVES